MAPNPFVMLKMAASPHKWFDSKSTPRRSSSAQSVKQVELWNEPYPGTYEYKPGRGWYLIEFADVDESELSEPAKKFKPARLPHQVRYCKLLHRHMFPAEYEARRRTERVQNEMGKWVVGHFFRLDDNVTYVECWDSEGSFTEGPYKRWCVDKDTNRLRGMTYKDAPVINGKRLSQSTQDERPNPQRQMSVVDISGPSSPVPSRPASIRPPLRRPALGPKSASTASTTTNASLVPTSAMTTPSSGVEPKVEEVDPMALREKLEVLRINP